MKHTDIIHISFSPDGEFISFWTRSDVRLAQYRLAHPESPIATFRAVKESLTVESKAAQVPPGWTIRREGDFLIVQHPDVGGCSVQKEPDSDQMIPEAILWALANDMLQAVNQKMTTEQEVRS